MTDSGPRDHPGAFIGRALLLVAVIYGVASALLPMLAIRLNQAGGCADGVFDGGDTNSEFLLPLGLSNVVVLFVLSLSVGCCAIVNPRWLRVALVLIVSLVVTLLATVAWLGSFCQAD